MLIQGVRVKLLFPGVDNHPGQGQRIRKGMAGYENYVSTSDRIPKAQLIDIMVSAHLFLMIGTPGFKGHHSSKIFEYLAMKRPVVLCPDDSSVMSELMHDTNAGFILNSEDEVQDFLNTAYIDFKIRKGYTL